MGFIGSGFVSFLNHLGHHNIIVVDDFYQWKKEINLHGKRVHEWVHRDLFIRYFEKCASQIRVVFHLGARTDTISEDQSIFDALNRDYSKAIWTICAQHDIPLIYASSAATYGDGSLGFEDAHELAERLKPLNAYARSKQAFDLWALQQSSHPPRWYGLKFFNVYGPNEYHKGRMASVICHAFQQIQDSGSLNLFRSHHPDYVDGGQRRDFIYVMDVFRMMWDVYSQSPPSGLYNVGTGNSRTFEDLGKAVFNAMGLDPAIVYIDMPQDLREKYQYFTEAEMHKWNAAGLSHPATSLEMGVSEYVQQFLRPGQHY